MRVPDNGSRKRAEANAIETKQPFVRRQPQRSVFGLSEVENRTKGNVSSAPLGVDQVRDFRGLVTRHERRRRQKKAKIRSR